MPPDRGAQQQQAGAGLADPGPLGEGVRGRLDPPPVDRRDQEAGGGRLREPAEVGGPEGVGDDGHRGVLDLGELPGRRRGDAGEQPGRRGRPGRPARPASAASRSAAAADPTVSAKPSPTRSSPRTVAPVRTSNRPLATRAAGSEAMPPGRPAKTGPVRGRQPGGGLQQRAAPGERDQLRRRGPGRQVGRVAGVDPAQQRLDQPVDDLGPNRSATSDATERSSVRSVGGTVGSRRTRSSASSSSTPDAARPSRSSGTPISERGSGRRLPRVQTPDDVDGRVDHVEPQPPGQVDGLGAAVQHRLGTDVDGDPADLGGAELAADLGRPLEDQDVVVGGEQVGRGEPRDAASDDDDPTRSRCPRGQDREPVRVPRRPSPMNSTVDDTGQRRRSLAPTVLWALLLAAGLGLAGCGSGGGRGVRRARLGSGGRGRPRRPGRRPGRAECPGPGLRRRVGRPRRRGRGGARQRCPARDHPDRLADRAERRRRRRPVRPGEGGRLLPRVDRRREDHGQHGGRGAAVAGRAADPERRLRRRHERPRRPRQGDRLDPQGPGRHRRGDRHPGADPGAGAEPAPGPGAVQPGPGHPRHRRDRGASSAAARPSSTRSRDSSPSSRTRPRCPRSPSTSSRRPTSRRGPRPIRTTPPSSAASRAAGTRCSTLGAGLATVAGALLPFAVLALLVGVPLAILVRRWLTRHPLRRPAVEA